MRRHHEWGDYLLASDEGLLKQSKTGQAFILSTFKSYMSNICGTSKVKLIKNQCKNHRVSFWKLVFIVVHFKDLGHRFVKPHVWYRYVDDTFMILHEYAIQEFAEHINSQSKHIKFTIETEQDGQLPFLDTLQACDTEWWWHTEDQDLPKTHGPIIELGLQPHKRSIVCTLLCWAETVMSEPEM